MAEPVHYRVADGIATVSIVNPNRRNTLTPAVVDGLDEALTAATDARCLLLRGEGDTFCTGGDLVGIVEHTHGELTREALLDRLAGIDDLIERLYRFPIPTVAAVDGPAFGIGGTLVLACDLAVAAETAKIGFGFGRIGMPPGGGTSALLPRAVGPSAARELLFTGELLEAGRAAKLGLFDRTYPASEFTAGVASLVDAIVTDGIALHNETKQLLIENDGLSLSATMAAERAATRRLLGTEQQLERIRSFLEAGGSKHGRDPTTVDKE
ncbi:enoyl-CoA hydratase/isomerase family protein [Halorhabdus amylolytica]|uniref:enoyl-CoA hydratase/isomerase family protein n=1 Tax=Halorhabdus amylolytica TaxID=2559573 RepID=UPI0010AA0281|nr:enoyl-CoA hydratase/isomerase family protein [Halorhabdus amylolytica]